MGIEKKSYGPIIDGKVVETKETFAAINPADSSELAQVFAAGEQEINAAVASSQKAFESWGKSTYGQRVKALEAIANILENDLDGFAEYETLDTGKSINESRMHLGNCIEIYRYFAAAIRAHEDRVVQYDNGNISIVLREPLGVVGLILPWNAPSMLLAWKLAPALAAGNAVVVKPASSASLVPINLVEKFQAALPPGVLNLVTGSGPKVGTPLADHPGISKISFTGSVEAGRILGAKASQNIIPVTLELGGKSASIIFEDSHVDRALQFAVLASVSSAGAICVSSSRILVQDTIYDSFVAKIKEKYDALATTAGNPLDPASGVAPIIDKTQYERIIGYIESGISEGAKLVSGGKRITGGICDKGYYMEPTLFANVTKDMTIAKEEIFGSVLSIMRFSTEEEAIEIANSTQYGLASAVWTKDIYKATRVSRALQAGIVWVNDYMDISAGGPFGGYKKSGFGREINKMAIDYYSNTKNINISSDETTPQMF